MIRRDRERKPFEARAWSLLNGIKTHPTYYTLTMASFCDAIHTFFLYAKLYSENATRSFHSEKLTD